MSLGTAGIHSSCFQLKQERPLWDSRRPVHSETSHAGIIRIGFEGISQPRLSEHPCFNNKIETLSPTPCKSNRRAPALNCWSGPNRREKRTICLQSGHGESLHFGRIVGAPKPDG